MLEVVEGAAFYLLCHDDVALAPDGVRLLVEEAYRSNAAVVGPKLVDWDDPRRLLQVGQGMDHAGYGVPLVERGELDQSQHDAVRDVFTVPGPCTLVRADLFAEIGGFDEGISDFLDDVSLCWRAHIAGARVIVAPDAAAATATRLAASDVATTSAAASRPGTACASSSAATGPIGLVPCRRCRRSCSTSSRSSTRSLAGRRRRVGDIVHAWTWNLRRLAELRVARRQVKALPRTCPTARSARR